MLSSPDFLVPGYAFHPQTSHKSHMSPLTLVQDSGIQCQALPKEFSTINWPLTALPQLPTVLPASLYWLHTVLVAHCFGNPFSPSLLSSYNVCFHSHNQIPDPQHDHDCSMGCHNMAVYVYSDYKPLCCSRTSCACFGH